MQLIYRLLADVVVFLHLAWVLVVVFGLVLTLVGALRKWKWVRNFWFRSIHLGMIGLVVLESWLGIVCPLTVWENNLRRLAGEETYSGGFIATWVHAALFFELPTWAFTLTYSLFGLAVLCTFLFAPPRSPFRQPASDAAVEGEGV